MRKFITGFITGGIICAAVSAVATGYIANPNPYPVRVNGSAADIEGYNINDSTYFKLRDVADAVGGFSVAFADNTIVINSGETTAPTASETPTAVSASTVTLPEIKPYTLNGVDYVWESDIIKTLEDFGVNDYVFSTKGLMSKKTFEIVLSDIPRLPDSSLIPYDYYVSTFAPFLTSLIAAE